MASVASSEEGVREGGRVRVLLIEDFRKNWRQDLLLADEMEQSTPSRDNCKQVLQLVQCVPP